jgi:hypothetical protein
MSFWSDIGSFAVNFVLDQFTGGSDQPTGGGGASSADMQRQSAQQTAYQQANLAQRRADTGIREGRAVSPFRAQNEMANFVKSNIEPDEVRNQVVAQLIRQGADPMTVKNILAQWDTQDRALAEPRKGLPQEGFAQTRIT